MIDFIANPTAGGKFGKKIKKTIAKIEEYLLAKRIDYSIHYTKKTKRATEITKELIANNAETIVAVGGDGTLHEVLNGFSNFEKTALGIIPCGTGNDFAASINIPLDPIKALEIVLNEEAKYTDFMQMPTVRGLNTIGMGIDVDVLERYSKLKKKTQFGYTKCLIGALFNVKFTKIKAELNDKIKETTSFLACVANGYRIGGGMPICPGATPTDNKLDFMTYDEVHGFKIVKAFIKLKKGKIFDSKEAHHDYTEEVKIYPEGDYTVNVDGELYKNIPFEVKIVPNKLRIFRV